MESQKSNLKKILISNNPKLIKFINKITLNSNQTNYMRFVNFLLNKLIKHKSKI